MNPTYFQGANVIYNAVDEQWEVELVNNEYSRWKLKSFDTQKEALNYAKRLSLFSSLQYTLNGMVYSEAI